MNVHGGARKVEIAVIIIHDVSNAIIIVAIARNASERARVGWADRTIDEIDHKIPTYLPSSRAFFAGT
jgi:homoaconitase/3-isopropylmalate dehydratase large subunit